MTSCAISFSGKGVGRPLWLQVGAESLRLASQSQATYWRLLTQSNILSPFVSKGKIQLVHWHSETSRAIQQLLPVNRAVLKTPMSLCTAMCGLVFGLECRHGLAPPLAGRLTWCTSLKADAVSRKLQTTDLPVSIPSTAKVHFRTALQDFYCPWCHTTVAWVSVHSTGKAKLVEVK